jgi:hypothetical protein
MKLFKIITDKDDIVVGLSAAELKALGSGPELDALARHLAKEGQMTTWQYAVQRGGDGSLVQAPLKRVAIFKTSTLRIEPFDPAPLTVKPPA